ncbi:MAG: D-alanyl-D-alanine carboxypeptidase [Mogibacterium sp.]|nr:D-alanyl-D-alanine carboxypeptidase [Mogibacterium sp.]
MRTDAAIRREIIEKRRRKAKIRRALFAALLLIVLLLILPSKASTSFDRSLIKPYGNPDAEAPKLQAEAAAIYSLDLDKHVYEKNGDKKIDPYSITKILTCYLALENLDPKEIVTIQKSNEDLNYVEGSHILLLKGEKISVNDLIYGTMLASANEAAYALAVTVSGSEKNFAEVMNKQAEEWGCKDTHFVNPNGWKNKNHYTTAHDMAIITSHCFENEKLREISMTKKYTIPETNMSEQRELENAFLRGTGRIKNINAGKTGSWEEDDCSIVLEYTEDHLNAAMVLLRDTMKKRPADIKKLMKFSHEVTPGFTVASEGDIACEARVKGGAETVVPLSMDKTIHIYPEDNKERKIKVDVEADKLEAPLAKGSKAGTYKVMLDGEEVESGELLAAKDVEKGWIFSKLYISNNSAIAGAVIMLLALLLMTLLSKTQKNNSAR